MTAGSDDFADAPAVTLNTVTAAFSNIGYTVETGEQTPAMNPALDPASEWFGATWAFKRSAWWRFDADISQATQVHTQRSAYDPLYATYTPDLLISVYQGASLDALILVARGSLEDVTGVGNTASYTPWVANWAAVAGVTYYIQIYSIYDEDINCQLTVVPTPTVSTGDWLDGDPVEIALDGVHAEVGVDSTGSDTTAAWGGGTISGSTAVGELFIAEAGGILTPTASFSVGWHRLDASWPSSPTYTGSVPVAEPAEPAHDSIEWDPSPAEGTSSAWHLSMDFNTAVGEWTQPDGTHRDGDVDTLGTAKLAGYDLPGTSGVPYNPGFLAPGTVGALTTLGTGHGGDTIDFSIPTGTGSVELGVIDPYSLAGTPPALDPGDLFEVGVSLSPFPSFFATAVPLYRYTYTDAPVTVGPPVPVIVGQIDSTRVRPYGVTG